MGHCLSLALIMITGVLNIFAQSPFKPIQQHIKVVHECALLLKPLIDQSISEDWPAVLQSVKKISKLEEQADQLKKEIRLNLPNHIFMPVARHDLLELLTVQDKMANRSKDIAGLIYNRRMVLPAGISDTYKQFLARVCDTNQQALEAVNKLDELIETGFKGFEAKLVKAMVQHLDMLEDETDTIHRQICLDLFAVEKSLPPVDVMFLYKIFDWTGEIADVSQRIGHRLQLMLAK